MYKQLAELFAGNNTQYIQATLTGGKDERGKRKADYLTVHKPLTEEIWKDHIDGKIVIGLKIIYLFFFNLSRINVVEIIKAI